MSVAFIVFMAFVAAVVLVAKLVLDPRSSVFNIATIIVFWAVVACANETLNFTGATLWLAQLFPAVVFGLVIIILFMWSCIPFIKASKNEK